MRAKNLFLTFNSLLMTLSAAALHAAEAGQVDTARPYDCPAPVLPTVALQQEMFGDVTLQYRGSPAGKVTDIKILKSSGFHPLDKAAVIALARCKMAPVAVTAGEAVPPQTMEYKFGRQARPDKPSF